MRKTWMMGVAALLVVAIAGGAVWYVRGRSPGAKPGGTPLAGGGPAEVALKPVKADSTGVDVASSFILTAEQPLKAADVKQSLQVEPAVALAVEARSSKEFIVKPAAALEANRIYRFKLAPAAGVSRAYQWSFQTKATFRILGTLPRNQASGVPLNTGIELIFSHENYADPGSLFSISPAVAGKFERHKQTLAFVPTEPLQSGTVYTVTLKQGLTQTGAEGRLTQDFRFSFETQPPGDNQSGRQKALSVPENLLEYPAGEAPYFLVYTNDLNQKLDVTVHRYKDAAGFAAALAAADQVPWWASWSRGQYVESTAGLTQVMAFQGQLKEYEQYGTYLVLPDSLPPGYYMATLKADAVSQQVRFQVTDLSSYASVTTTKTLVWLNDLATGRPAAGAKVTALATDKPATATTGADGVATLPTPPDASAGGNWPGLYLQARAGDKEAVVAVPWDRYYRGANPGTTLAVQYWRYLYLDRQLYKPEDTVNLWGVVRPREPGAQPVTEVTALVTRGGYYDAAQQPVPLAKAVIPVKDSTFTGRLELPGLRAGWYEVELRMGDELLSSRYFEVQNFVKPAYRIESSMSRRAIFSGDPVDLTVKAGFFEGTPVPNLPLSFTMQKDGQSLTTGADGTTTVTLHPIGGGNYGADYQYYFVRATLPEAGEISDSGLLMVYGRDMQLQRSVKVEEGRAIVSGQVNRISLDAVNAGDGWDVTGAPVVGHQVTLTLTEQNWTKIEKGTYYDFLSKTTHKLYEYVANPREVGTTTVTTGEGGKFSAPLTIDPQKSYLVDVAIRDSQGRTVSDQLGFSGQWYQGMTDSLYWGNWHYLTTIPETKSTYALGEPVNLELRREQGHIPDRDQGFLFYTARLGLQEYRVQSSSRFTYALKEQDLPTTSVNGVCFDGRSYYEAGSFTVRFEPKARELQVRVTADKPAYKPGDTVNLSVLVTDQAGKPVQAQVNLNLVDEAVYALRDQSVDLLKSLYGEYMPTGILRTHRSHQVPKPTGMAEKGGDGGGARKDFKDAVFFETVTTDARGAATASFKVPDNLTTWRVTWQALVPETMQAASGTTGVAVKLPFFVDTVQAQTYLTGDRPLITARTYGTALQAGNSAKLSATLEGQAQWQSGDLLARAFDPLGLKLPVLSQPGTYQLTVRGEGPGGLTDALQKPITVVDSYLKQKRVDFKLLEAGTGVGAGPDSGLVTLLLSDYDRGRYYRLLQQMRWQGGNRLEQKLARLTAQQLMQAHFDTQERSYWWEEEPAFDTYAFQTQNGGIAYLPYADADLELTAKAVDLAPGSFDAFAVQQYLQSVLDDDKESRERKLMALYGMAALGQPVLMQAQQLLELKDLSLTEQLYLALTVAELGDLEGARPLYRAVVTEHGEALGADARIKTGRDQDEILSRTALAGMVAAKLGEPEAPAFAGYLLTNWAGELLLVLEEANMVNDGLPRLSDQPVAVTYVLDGKATQVQLKPGQTRSLLVTAKQAAAMQFKELQGKVGLTAIYEAPLSRTDLKQREGFTVSRSYAVVGGSGNTTSFKVGDLIKVTLKVELPATAPGGAYELSDYLPSGLRIVARPWQQGIQWGGVNDPAWPIDVNGQKATFWVGREAASISYYARVVTAGQYTAEEPVLQNGRSGQIYGFAPRVQVNIE